MHRSGTLPGLTTCSRCKHCKVEGGTCGACQHPDNIVVRVIDGDTIVVQVNGHPETVRLIGVDTPETKDGAFGSWDDGLVDMSAIAYGFRGGFAQRSASTGGIGGGMFIRRVNGRAYLAESVRVGGRVVQRHLGPATPDGLLLIRLEAQEREVERQEQRQRRDEEHERDRQLAEHWTTVRREFESTMRSAGYHNPNWRGWRKRRAGQTAVGQERDEGGADA